MKMKRENWMREGEHEFTKSNNMKLASYSEVCNWIVECWNQISEDVIKNRFKKAKICCYEDEIENHYNSDTDIQECDEIQFGCDEAPCDEADDINLLVNDLNEKCTIEFISDDEFDGFN